MTSSLLSQICRRWKDYQLALGELPRLSQLKSFHDQVLCDPALRLVIDNILPDFLSDQYPELGLGDVGLFLPAKLAEKYMNHNEPTLEAKVLLDALKLDGQFRHLQKQLQPSHVGWSQWRDLQITRYAHEDKSIRASLITHIPFAIELSDGCSGGCSFCGVSAQPLRMRGIPLDPNKELYLNLLAILKSYSGNMGCNGVLYWATDPFDNPYYEDYANIFRQFFGHWPATTTALGEEQPDRIQSILNSSMIDRPWGLRCSLRSPFAYRKLFDALSARERAILRFIPQYPGSASTFAFAGRAYREGHASLQTQSGGTIACMSGFLISLPRKEIQLVTPCRAEPKHINGYRVLDRVTFESVHDLPSAFEKLFVSLPCPPIHLDSILTVTIDQSQFGLYSSEDLPPILSRIDKSPASLSSLMSEYGKNCNYKVLYLYCLRLLQFGVLRVA